MSSTGGWLFENNGKLFQPDMKQEFFLGKGAYGNVFRSHVRTKTGVGEVCAVKHMDLGNIAKQITREQCDAEVRIMISCLNEPHLVQYIGSAYKETILTYAIAMELAIAPLDLFTSNSARSIQGLPYEIFIDVIRDCTSALRSLQTKNIAHRDIKSGNVLVFPGPSKGRRSKFLFKMSDFGFSKQKNTRESMMTSVVGTPNHLHPALAWNYWKSEHNTYTSEECDIWSLACAFHYTARNKHAFDAPNTEQYCLWVKDMIRRPELGGAIGAAAKADGKYEYVFKLENKNYPKWFQHCATRMLVSMFHKQKLNELEVVSHAFVEAEESTFIILDAPDKLQIVKYADLSRVELFKANYPKLHEELGIPELGEDYCVISNISIDKFTNYFDPQPGKTYIVMRHNYKKNFNQFELPTWQFQVAETRTPEDKSDTYVLRSYKILKAHEALTDGDNLYKLYVGMVQTLGGILEKLEASHGCDAHIERMEFHKKLAGCLEALTKFTAVVAKEHVNKNNLQTLPQCTGSLEQNKVKLNQILDEIKKLKVTLKTYKLEDHEIVGIEDELSTMLVDPTTKPQAYNETKEYCLRLQADCIERKRKIAKQLQDLLNRKDGLFCMALKVRELHYRMQEIQTDISNDRRAIEQPLQHLADNVFLNSKITTDHITAAMRLLEQPSKEEREKERMRQHLARIREMRANLEQWNGQT